MAFGVSDGPPFRRDGQGTLSFSSSAIGSMCAPLACQSFIAAGLPWNLFFFGSLVLSVISALLAFYAFRPTAIEFDGDVSRAVREAQSQSSSSATLTQDKEPKLSSTVKEENVGLAEIKDAPAPTKSASRLLEMTRSSTTMI